MAINHLFRSQKARLLVIMLVLFGMTSIAGTILPHEGYAAPSEPVPLVRVDLDELAAQQAFSALDLPVYLQLLKPGGGLLVLLPADAQAQEQLVALGFSFEVIDPDARQANYYLLQGDVPALRRASELTSPLLQEGDQVVVRLETGGDAPLVATGVRMMPLSLQSLAAPRQVADAPALPQVLAANPLIQRLVNRVSRNTLYQYVGDLSGEWPVVVNGSPYTFDTRNTYQYTPITKATRFTHDYFQSRGILADYHYYYLNSYERRNVLAQQTGLTQPNRYFLLIAHLDSYSQSPATDAPGADDNASGSAAVMHIAEILAGYPFGCTLRYVLFTGEEQGLYGSWAYADLMASQGVNIVAVLNLDMVAYSPSSNAPVIDLHTRESNASDTEIAELFADTVSAYQLDLVPTIHNDGLSFSDHYPFWRNHYPGILAIEDWTYHTPNYHTTGDRLSTLNMDYYTEFTKAALATYAHMGCLMEGDLAGVVREAGSGLPISGAVVTVWPQNDDPWVTYSGADGSYQLPLYVGSYTVSASAPGYFPGTPTGTQITQNNETQLDITLQTPVAAVYLPLVLSTHP